MTRDDPRLRRRLVAPDPALAAGLDVDRPQRRLAAYLADRRIAHVDLLEPFRAAAGERRLYKLRDTHWSAAGNRLAGEVLAGSVVAQGLGPEPR